MTDATGFNANADMACGRIDDRQVGELQLAWAHRLHRPIGGLRRRHSRLPWISFGPKQCSRNLPACGRALKLSERYRVPTNSVRSKKPPNQPPSSAQLQQACPGLTAREGSVLRRRAPFAP